MTFDGLTFAVDNKTVAARLLRLIDWLEDEQRRLTDELATVREDPPKRDAMGRVLLGENGRRRESLKTRIEQAEADRTAAQCWLLECEQNQTWQLGMQLALWLNRPALAQCKAG